MSQERLHSLYTSPPLPDNFSTIIQANGVFAFGVYVGGGLSSLSIAMAQGIGWRASAYTVAGYGLLLSLLVRFTVREPARTPAATAPAPANRTSEAEEGGGYAPANGSSGDAEKDYTARERWVTSACYLHAGRGSFLWKDLGGGCRGAMKEGLHDRKREGGSWAG